MPVTVGGFRILRSGNNTTLEHNDAGEVISSFNNVNK